MHHMSTSIRTIMGMTINAIVIMIVNANMMAKNVIVKKSMMTVIAVISIKLNVIN